MLNEIAVPDPCYPRQQWFLLLSQHWHIIIVVISAASSCHTVMPICQSFITLTSPRALLAFPLSALIYLSWITSPKFISLSFHGLNLKGVFLAALGMSLDTFEFFFPWHLESHLIYYNLSLLIHHSLFTLLDQGTYQHQGKKKKRWCYWNSLQITLQVNRTSSFPHSWSCWSILWILMERRLQPVLATGMLTDSTAAVQKSSQRIQTYDFAFNCPDPEDE